MRNLITMAFALAMFLAPACAQTEWFTPSMRDMRHPDATAWQASNWVMDLGGDLWLYDTDKSHTFRFVKSGLTANAEISLATLAALSGSGALSLTAEEDSDLTVKLGDADGAQKMSWIDSGDTEVASLDSDGNLLSLSLDSLSANPLALGASNATKVEIADAGVETEIQGPLEVQEAATFDASVTIISGGDADGEILKEVRYASGDGGYREVCYREVVAVGGSAVANVASSITLPDGCWILAVVGNVDSAITGASGCTDVSIGDGTYMFAVSTALTLDAKLSGGNPGPFSFGASMPQVDDKTISIYATASGVATGTIQNGSVEVIIYTREFINAADQ